MEQYLNYYMEDEATTSAGDVGEFTPQLSTTKRKALEAKKKKFEAAKKDYDEAKKKLEGADFADDGDGLGEVDKKKKKLEMKKKKLEMKKKKAEGENPFAKKDDKKKSKLTENSNMIEETENYKFYNDGDRKVFEILDEADFNMFYQGLKKANNRIWRQGETCSKMMEHMNKNRGLWFEVRFGDRIYKPFDKGF